MLRGSIVNVRGKYEKVLDTVLFRVMLLLQFTPFKQTSSNKLLIPADYKTAPRSECGIISG